MFTIYDELNGERIFVKSCNDELAAESYLVHLKNDFPEFNLIIVEE